MFEHLGPAPRGVRLRRIASSPWMILVAMLVGWGPVFAAELVGRVSPDLDASYKPAGFATAWAPMALACSFVALVLGVVHLIAYLFSHPGEGE